MNKLKYLRIRPEGVVAATALLSATLAGMLALLSVDSLSGTREFALIAFSAAIPLLSFSISVELIKTTKPNAYHLIIMLIGAACGLVGLACAIYYLSVIAAVVFIVFSLLVIVLSRFIPTAD
jgi:hypothetical protein